MKRSTFKPSPVLNVPFGLRSISTRDLNELTKFTSDYNRGYTQLTPGDASFEFTDYFFQGIRVLNESHTTGCFTEGVPRPDTLSIALVSSPKSQGKIFGQHNLYDNFFHISRQAWEANFLSEVKGMTVVFNVDDFHRKLSQLKHIDMPMKWRTSDVRGTHPESLKQLRSTLATVSSNLSNSPSLVGHHMVTKLWSDRLFDAVLQSFIPSQTGVKESKIQFQKTHGVQKALDYIRENAQNLPAMHELCAVSGLSERNLQYGFRDRIGVSPMQFSKLYRLNQVKKELSICDAKFTQVSHVAMQWGFFELGRFSGDYKKLFGELPSQTLKKG